MNTITITINNQTNFQFMTQLLSRFDFISQIKIDSENVHEQINNDEISAFKEKYAHLPIRWGTCDFKISDFAGMWVGKNITLDKIREKAWKRN